MGGWEQLDQSCCFIICCCAVVCCCVVACCCAVCCCIIVVVLFVVSLSVIVLLFVVSLSVVVLLFVVGVLSLQDTEQESWLSCLQPLYNVKTLSSEDPANLAKGVGLKG